MQMSDFFLLGNSPSNHIIIAERKYHIEHVDWKKETFHKEQQSEILTQIKKKTPEIDNAFEN